MKMEAEVLDLEILVIEVHLLFPIKTLTTFLPVSFQEHSLCESYHAFHSTEEVEKKVLLVGRN